MATISNHFTYLYNDNLYPIQHQCVIKGDSLHKEISALLRSWQKYRDKFIQDFIEENPEYQEKYCLLSNKGYGTKAHIRYQTIWIFISSQIL